MWRTSKYLLKLVSVVSVLKVLLNSVIVLIRRSVKHSVGNWPMEALMSTNT